MAAGNPVVFTKRRQSYNELLDKNVETVTTVPGRAIFKSSGDPELYEKLGLSLETSPFLLFIPSGYPIKAYSEAFVRPGDTVDLLGTVYTAKYVGPPTAPDGYVVCCNIVVGK